MFSRFFIDRPRFAVVIALLITLGGAVSLWSLPVEQFPPISPPEVRVEARYPGASADVIESTVSVPIEAQVNGVENMLYMSSRSNNDGSYQLTVTFEVGTDPDLAAVNVQNRVALATSQLPEDVVRQGITVRKQSASFLLFVSFASPGGTHDEIYLSNYANIHVRDVLARVPGVGDARLFGLRDYSMRVWLEPDRMTSLGVTAGDVAGAIREQNVQAAAGQIGLPPVAKDQQFQYTVRVRGRLADVEEFEDIIVRARPDGSFVHLRDVARVELGALSYSSFGRLNGSPSVNMAVYQLPEANALEVADGVRAQLAVLAQSFPEDVTYKVVYDTTKFISASLRELATTLLIALALVVLVVYVFLQDARSTLIPTAAIPVSLVGTFMVLQAFGYTINTLTLFGLVLAIGIVVDDA
ncbi:MAG: efflux RND transporter permease subunit, partial [Myxococcales bacterium]|nr:efflux RND transporter permease subunit [Myxococcales bacterium]